MNVLPEKNCLQLILKKPKKDLSGLPTYGGNTGERRKGGVVHDFYIFEAIFTFQGERAGRSGDLCHRHAWGGADEGCMWSRYTLIYDFWDQETTWDLPETFFTSSAIISDICLSRRRRPWLPDFSQWQVKIKMIWSWRKPNLYFAILFYYLSAWQWSLV